MEFKKSSIPDVIIIEPRVWEDDRGFFFESYRRDEFLSQGIAADFVQENLSRSRGGVLRGLHYQIRQSQGKLIRAISGEIFDVAVDLRRRSPTFAKWTGVTLSSENRLMLWIPPGFAHGFFVTGDHADVIYKTTDYFAPVWERTLLWNDPEVGIEWPMKEGRIPSLSAKDAAGTPLAKVEAFS